MRSGAIILCGLLLLGATACERIPVAWIIDRDSRGEEERDQRRLEQLRAEIDALVGQAACADESECRYIGLGAKPCGGVWEFLIYSVSSVDTTALRQKVEEYNAFEARMNRRYGYVSDCSLAAVPTLGCVAGQCVDLNRVDAGSPIPPGDDPAEAVNLILVESADQIEQGDPFSLQEAEIRGDLLRLVVGYSGGCRTHQFALQAGPGYTKSLPPQHPVVLVHDADEDMCEAYIVEERWFDLSPLRRIHAGLEKVIVTLEGWEEPLEYAF
jgi:hypothetical protein